MILISGSRDFFWGRLCWNADLMTDIYIVRHGQSAANVGEITHDPAQIPLTQTGVQQAADLASLLEITPRQVITSNYVRAKNTAQPFCQRWGLSSRELPVLHEFVTLSPSVVNGTSVDFRKPLIDAYWDAAEPQVQHGEDSESFEQFAARVNQFRGQLAALGHNTVIFGHGMWFALLIWQLQGFGWRDSLSMAAFRRYQLALPMPNCGVYVLRSQGGDSWAVSFQEHLYRKLQHDSSSDARGQVMGGG